MIEKEKKKLSHSPARLSVQLKISKIINAFTINDVIYIHSNGNLNKKHRWLRQKQSLMLWCWK